MFSDDSYHNDFNIYLSWYIKLKDNQAINLDCKVWDIKKGNHKGV